MLNQGVLFVKVLPLQYLLLSYQVTDYCIDYTLYEGLFDLDEVLAYKSGVEFEVDEEGEVDTEEDLYDVIRFRWRKWIGNKIEIIPILSERWLGIAKLGVIYDVAPFKKREFYHHVKR